MSDTPLLGSIVFSPLSNINITNSTPPTFKGRLTQPNPYFQLHTSSRQYEDALEYIDCVGAVKGDRTGTGTKSVFGLQMRFDLSLGFPLVTTKKVFTKAIIHELLWFLKGETNIKYLVDNNVHIWDEWADENGNLGPVYGSQWRSWKGQSIVKHVNTLDGVRQEMHTPIIDQIAQVVAQLKANPDSRRHIVTAWNPAEVDQMKLPPCHCLFQFYVVNGKLSCQLYQRSADFFLGVPFNIASYALLTHMIAQQCNLEVGEFIWTGGDCHIYSNHKEQVSLQLSRTEYPYPTLQINRKPESIFDYKYEDFEVLNYRCHAAIKGQVAV